MERKQQVILVDTKDRRIGTAEKLKAHSNGGILHRAISIFIFNKKGQTLLQKRANGKYHTPGKWSNTCCSHPMPGEKVISSAHRRLSEELGFDCKMGEAFEFMYEAEVGNGLKEREYDHVIFGFFEGSPQPNPNEVSDYKWVNLKDLKSQIAKSPNSFTPWLRLVINKVSDRYFNAAKENKV